MIDSATRRIPIEPLAVASTSVSKGLNPGLSILAVFIGHLLVCVPAMLDGYVGSMFGINFPVFTRASFGMRGSYFAISIRGVVACIWFGTQSFQVSSSDLQQSLNLTSLLGRSMSANYDLCHLAQFQSPPKPFAY